MSDCVTELILEDTVYLVDGVVRTDTSKRVEKTHGPVTETGSDRDEPCTPE